MMQYENEHINLLLIEGDDNVRSTFKSYINDSGLNITTTEVIDGTSAISICKINRFDCILLDYDLSDTNALKILSSLHKGINTSTPAIVFTESEKKSLDLEILEAGAIDFIAKQDCNTILLKQLILYALVRNRYQESQTEYIEQQRQNKEQERLNCVLVAMERAEAANEAKTQFISSMSHELRTPLNAILGFTQLLERKQKKSIENEQGEFIQEILKAGTHLLNLINEVLDLSKIEAGQLKFNMGSVDPDNIILDCQSLTSNLAKQYNCTVTYQKPKFELSPVLSDPVRLKQVLLNLITNAIKYNKDHGQVTISYKLLNHSHLKINVADTGIGIDPDRISEVFEPFSRLNETKANIEGTGIGLTIAHKMMALMNGKIDVISKLNIGSNFWLEVPLYSPLDNLKITDKSLKKLLVIDCNSKSNQSKDSILDALKSYSFLELDSLDKGILWTKNQLASFVLVYIHSIDDSLLQNLNLFKQSANMASIPIIVIAQNITNNETTHILNTGVDQCLCEPIEPHILKNIIDYNMKN